MELKRKFFQFLFALLNNSYILFPFTRKIYQGNLKFICSPGLNCYSCPASIFACPIGAIQNFLTTIRFNISLGKYLFGFYVFGFLGTIGLLGGRIVCAWACPFGLVQEILYKIPIKKISLNFYRLNYLKFGILFFLVILLPVFFTDKFGIGEPYFCKFFCPAGTLEAGLTLPFFIPSLKKFIGILYYYKLVILIFFIIAFIFIKRPFCRFFCPLGAIYSIFNKISFLKLVKDSKKCNKCLNCEKVCPMEIKLENIPSSIECIRCFNCASVCPEKAIEIKFN